MPITAVRQKLEEKLSIPKVSRTDYPKGPHESTGEYHTRLKLQERREAVSAIKFYLTKDDTTRAIKLTADLLEDLIG